MVQHDLELGILLRRRVGLAVVVGRIRFEVDAEHGAAAGDACLDARLGDHSLDARHRPGGKCIDPSDRSLVKQAHGRQSRDHRDRVRRESSRVREEHLISQRVHDVHHLCATGDGPHREAAADGLAKGGQVRGHIEPLLSSTELRAEGHNLVEDEQRTVSLGPLTKGSHESRVGGSQPNAVRHGVDQHAGDLVPVFVEQSLRTHWIVKWDHDHIGQSIGGGAIGHGQADRMIRVAPSVGLRSLADLGVVVLAMVGTLHLGNLRAAGKCARRLDAGHDALGARVHEAQLLEARIAATDVLRKLDLDLGGQGKCGPSAQLFGNRSNDRGVCVAVQQRGHVIRAVDPAYTLDVRHDAALGEVCVEGVRRAQDRIAAHATGQDFLGALIESGARRLIAGAAHGANRC